MALREELGPYFGEYGGRFVPESLIEALDELDAAYQAARTDPEFEAELAELHAPTPAVPRSSPRSALRRARRRRAHHPQARRPQPHRVAQDQQRARPGAARQRLGKTRLIAETGAGQHGVATATAAALFGIECVVYMGEVDTERQALNVARMRLLGAEVMPVTIGSRTLKDAINDALRDWVANVETTHYLLGTVAGPHPFPVMVRDFHKIIGEEAREQVLALTGRLPDAVIACVGGGSNAMGIFHAFLDDEGVALVGYEAAGDGVDTPFHAATITKGRPGVLHGARSLLLQDEDGQTDRIALDLGRPRLPGRRSRARLARRSGAPSTFPSPTPRRWMPCACSPAPRASSPPSSRRTPCRHDGARPRARAGRHHSRQPQRPRRQRHGDRRTTSAFSTRTRRRPQHEHGRRHDRTRNDEA